MSQLSKEIKMTSDDAYMREAIAEAKLARGQNEIPVGAIIVKEGRIIGRGHNLTETLKDPTAHAEMIAIREAAKTLGGWRLFDCDMFVTCEPCSMCAGAIVWARLNRVVVGAPDPKSGACGSIFNIVQEKRLNHQAEIKTGVMQTECESMMKDFFKELRKKKSEETQI